MCVRVWRLRSKVSLNPFPQKVHRYRFSSEWHLACRLRRRWRENFLPQVRQMKAPGAELGAGVGSMSGGGAPFRIMGFFSPKPPFTHSMLPGVGTTPLLLVTAAAAGRADGRADGGRGESGSGALVGGCRDGAGVGVEGVGVMAEMVGVGGVV